MRGRKPTPTRLKALTGNPGKRPLKMTSLGLSPRSPTVLPNWVFSPGRNGTGWLPSSARSACSRSSIALHLQPTAAPMDSGPNPQKQSRSTA